MQIYATGDFFANKFVCTVIWLLSIHKMTDLLTRFCWKLIYMYVLWWCMSKRIYIFFKLLLVVANLCNLPVFANKLLCTVLTDLLTWFGWKLSEIINFFRSFFSKFKLQIAIHWAFSIFFSFFEKNYLFFSYAMSVCLSVCPSVCVNNFFCGN